MVAAVFALAFFVAKNCQDAQIELTEAEAVVAAEEQVDFIPEDVQVRLLRQGIDRRPYWIVSLSVLSADEQTYDELALVRIDATTGEIVELRDQSVDDGGPPGAEGGQQGPP